MRVSDQAVTPLRGSCGVLFSLSRRKETQMITGTFTAGNGLVLASPHPFGDGTAAAVAGIQAPRNTGMAI